jgi:two-component system sensor histidine kinase/response regulator
MVPAPVYFDVQEASRAITDSLQNVAESKVISMNNQIENRQAYADRDMFAVVVRNLTMNAIKYTSEEGAITLSSELKDDMLVISVKDNGTGMTQEVQDNLFKLSETISQRGTKNESGTGLGLVLCADFVKINGGSIWFTSKQGEGSTFFFSLPTKGS